MENGNQKNGVDEWPFWSILFGFTLLNFLQAAFLKLLDDECYYWMFSQHLDWGYFDHPPAIALMIKMGTLLAHQEWAVRLFSVLAQSLSLLFIWKTIDHPQRKNGEWLFWLLVLMLPVFQVYGFVATPDSPLLLFAAVFLFVLKKYLQKGNIANALLLAGAMAALMYSKYHGALFITLAFLPQWKFLKRPSFYFAVIISLLLYAPHFMWQLEYDFPSMQYHLVDRPAGSAFINPIRFIIEQFLVFNPLLLLLFIPVLKIKWTENYDFQKSLWAILIGLPVFFLFMSIKIKAEAHWLVVISIPLIILCYHALLDRKVSWRKFYHFALPSLLLIFALRLLLVSGLTEFPEEFYGAEEWTSKIQEVAKDSPVAFINSYQKASKYAFYSGSQTTSLNNVAYRKNQYDLWDQEERMQAKEVLICTSQTKEGFQLIEGVHPQAYCRKASGFHSVQKLQTNILVKEAKYDGTHWEAPLEIENPYAYSIEYKQAGFPLAAKAILYKDGQLIAFKEVAFVSAEPSQLLPESLTTHTVRFEAPNEDGLSVLISFYAGDLPPSIAAKPINLPKQ